MESKQEIVCKICGKTFNSSEKFQKHGAQEHGILVPGPGDDEPARVMPGIVDEDDTQDD